MRSLGVHELETQSYVAKETVQVDLYRSLDARWASLNGGEGARAVTLAGIAKEEAMAVEKRYHQIPSPLQPLTSLLAEVDVSFSQYIRCPTLICCLRRRKERPQSQSFLVTSV